MSNPALINTYQLGPPLNAISDRRSLKIHAAIIQAPHVLSPQKCAVGATKHPRQRAVSFGGVPPTVVCSAAAQPAALRDLRPSDAARVSDLKRRISSLAGTQNGTDLDEAQRTEINAVIKELEELNPASSPASVDLKGSEWDLVYSSSVAASAGRFGPFVGRVWQVCCPTAALSPSNHLNIPIDAHHTFLQVD